MPEISRFFGIIIRIVEVGGPHHRPHFHAYYQDQAAVFAIDSLECLGGELPKASSGWSKRGRRFIGKNYSRTGELLQSGQPPVKIDPLR